MILLKKRFTEAFFLALFLILFGLLVNGQANAHFLLNISIRIIHIEPLDNGLRLLIRLPMALLVADKIGPPTADGSREPAPYTRNVVENGELMHYLDITQLQSNSSGLADLVAQGHQVIIDSELLRPEIEAIVVYPATEQPRFSTLALAKQSLQGSIYPHDAEAGYIGDTIVDVMLFYPMDKPLTELAIAAQLKPGIAGEDEIANLILYHTPDKTHVFREIGLLTTPVIIKRSPLAAAMTFIKAGFQHILQGIDHVLFVVCLVLAAFTLGDLLWRVTGFTIGHSITLITGFLGYAPAASWFIPTVELLIALSIVYAGVIVVMRTMPSPSGTLFWLTAAIGLLHGFGFSFVLQNMLNADAPDLWLSLISFNVGVEIGQIAIVLVIWPVLYWLNRQSAKIDRYSRLLLAVPCIAVAALWSGERLGVLLQDAVL